MGKNGASTPFAGCRTRSLKSRQACCLSRVGVTTPAVHTSNMIVLAGGAASWSKTVSSYDVVMKLGL